MMKSTFATFVLAIALGVSAAEAATLLNSDATAHTITIVEDESRREFTIDAGQELSGICQSSCSLYMSDDPEPYDIVSTDKLEIQDGQLQYREEEQEGTVPAE